MGGGANISGGAIISGDYRYNLWRSWGVGPRLLWVMLNPSTADETIDDPTLRSCIRLSRHWEYGGLEIVNLFAYRSSKPRGLFTTTDPVGSENDYYLAEAAERATKIVLAWGGWTRIGAVRQRASDVSRLLLEHQEKLYFIERTQNGSPCHPLFVPTDVQLKWYGGLSTN